MARTISKKGLAQIGKARQRCGALFLVASLVVLPAGCATQDLSAKKLINGAVAKTGDLDSYRFTAKTIIGSKSGSKTISIAGDWQEPNRLRIVVDSEGQRQRIIMIGNQVFTKPKGSNEWRGASAPDGLEEQGIGSTITSLKQFNTASIIKNTKLNGHQVIQVQANYDINVFVGDLATNTATVLGAASPRAVANLWIDKKTDMLRKIVIKQAASESVDPKYSVEIRVSLDEFNKVPEIKAPAIASP